MKTFILLLFAIGFILILFYGSRHKVALHWLPEKPQSSVEYQDVKTDTDIHDAIDFVK